MAVLPRSNSAELLWLTARELDSLIGLVAMVWRQVSAWDPPRLSRTSHEGQERTVVAVVRGSQGG